MLHASYLVALATAKILLAAWCCLAVKAA